jgi:hypothetical protein
VARSILSAGIEERRAHVEIVKIQLRKTITTVRELIRIQGVKKTEAGAGEPAREEHPKDANIRRKKIMRLKNILKTV